MSERRVERRGLVYVPVWLLAAMILINAVGVVYAVNETCTLYYPQEVTVKKPEEQVVQVKMFSDSGLTTEWINGTTIGWGNCTPSTHYMDSWVKNTGNVEVELNMTVADLQPGWNYTWNGEGVTVNVGDIEQVTFALTIPTSAPVNYTFTFDVWIHATPT